MQDDDECYGHGAYEVRVKQVVGAFDVWVAFQVGFSLPR